MGRNSGSGFKFNVLVNWIPVHSTVRKSFFFTGTSEGEEGGEASHNKLEDMIKGLDYIFVVFRNLFTRHSNLFRVELSADRREARAGVHAGLYRNNKKNTKLFCSVVDPDPHGSGTFAWIWIRN